jgi:hypothetical protein
MCLNDVTFDASQMHEKSDPLLDAMQIVRAEVQRANKLFPDDETEATAAIAPTPRCEAGNARHMCRQANRGRASPRVIGVCVGVNAPLPAALVCRGHWRGLCRD